MNGMKYKTPLLLAIALLLFACNSPTPAAVPDNPQSGTALAAARTRVPLRKELATQQAKQTVQAMAGLANAKGLETPATSTPGTFSLGRSTGLAGSERSIRST